MRSVCHLSGKGRTQQCATSSEKNPFEGNFFYTLVYVFYKEAKQIQLCNISTSRGNNVERMQPLQQATLLSPKC